MNRHSRFLLLAVFWVVSLATLLVLARWYMRYLTVGQLLTDPARRARIEMVPGDKKFHGRDAAAAAMPVNLGYATFDAPDGTTNIKLSASGAGVVVIADTWSLELYRAYETANHVSGQMIEAGKKGIKHPETIRYLVDMDAGRIDASIEMERTFPLPARDLCWMSGKDFILYLMKLRGKAEVKGDEVWFFSNPQARGVIWIGHKAGDRTRARMQFATPDGRVAAYATFTKRGGSPGDIGQALERVAGSFRFTVDKVGSGEEMKKIIRDAGIEKEFDRSKELWDEDK